jgi:hypothetical protein
VRVNRVGQIFSAAVTGDGGDHHGPTSSRSVQGKRIAVGSCRRTLKMGSGRYRDT